MPGADLPPGVAGLVREDGSVVVPPGLAGEVLRRLLRDLTAEMQADGGHPTGRVYRLLWALRAAQDADDEGRNDPSPPAGFLSETPGRGDVIVEISAGDWARRHGCSVQYARRLAKAGRVPARRVGRLWLITEEAA